MEPLLADTLRSVCFHMLEIKNEEMPEPALKLRRGAGNAWQNVQQLYGARIHIFDNDTSG